MCTICAKVCHKDHDVSYAKYGSFFCDCGAKEDGSCLAMTKRPVSAPKSSDPAKPSDKSKDAKKINIKRLKKKTTKSNSVSSSATLAPSKQHQLLEKPQAEAKDKDSEFLNSLFKQSTVELLRKTLAQIRANKPKQLEKLRTQLVECAKAKDLMTTIRHIVEMILIPLAKKTYDNSLLNTSSALARSELAKLKHQSLVIPTSSQLLAANLEEKNEEENVEKRKTIAVKPSTFEQQPLFVVTLGKQNIKYGFDNHQRRFLAHDDQILVLVLDSVPD